jgi:hypothetical protein
LIDAAAEEAEGEEKKDHDDFDCNDVLNYDDDYTDDINSTDDFFGKGNDGQGESQDQGVVKNDYGDDHADDESWRQHGKKFRASLVLNDEEHGGNSFTLSNSCSIERYYRVADRVRTTCCVLSLFIHRPSGSSLRLHSCLRLLP